MNGKIASLLLGLCIGSAHADALRVGVTENDAAPLVIFQRTPQLQLSGGLWKDMLDEVGRQLGREIRYVPLPRKRLNRELQQGRIDMVCNTNPAWWHEPQLYQWSQPLSEQVERLVSPVGSPLQINSHAQLKGLRIGTVIGYRYPQLDEAFAAGAQRVDQQQANLQLRATASAVVDVAVIDELSYGWWQAQHANEASQVMLQPLVLARSPLSCALSQRSDLPLAKLNRAISTLDKQGVLAAKRIPYLPK